jgi:hypothetical protein
VLDIHGKILFLPFTTTDNSKDPHTDERETNHGSVRSINLFRNIIRSVTVIASATQEFLNENEIQDMLIIL